VTRAVTFPTFKHDPDGPVLMFKILVIQTINSLSHERTEYLINGQLSFMRFLGVEPVGSCPCPPRRYGCSASDSPKPVPSRPHQADRQANLLRPLNLASDGLFDSHD